MLPSGTMLVAIQAALPQHYYANGELAGTINPVRILLLAHDHALHARQISLLGGDFEIAVDDANDGQL